MRTFQRGQRVILPGNKAEGWPEERGVIFAVEDQRQWPGMYLVKLDDEHVEERGDDGIREVHADDLQPEKR